MKSIFFLILTLIIFTSCGGDDSKKSKCDDVKCGNATCNSLTGECACNDGYSGDPLTNCTQTNNCTNGQTKGCSCENGDIGSQTCVNEVWNECYCDPNNQNKGVGSQCTQNGDCLGENIECFLDENYMPGGYCTNQQCGTTGTVCLTDGVCLNANNKEFCYKTCEYGDDSSCGRTGYICEKVLNQNVCIPACTADIDCSNDFTFVCNESTGHCEANVGTKKIGESCGNAEAGNCNADGICVLPNDTATEGICMIVCYPEMGDGQCGNQCDPDVTDPYCCDPDDELQSQFCGLTCERLSNDSGACAKKVIGTKEIGESCNTTSEFCVPYGTCILETETSISGICMENCDFSNPECPDGFRCVTLNEGGAVCTNTLPPECTMVSNENCNANEICWVSDNGSKNCYPQGSGQPGSDCTPVNGEFVCITGYFCANNKCLEVCDDLNPCSTGSCRKFSGQTFGVCL